MPAKRRLPRGVTEEDLAYAKLRAARRRARAAEMADWDRQFAMLKHPGLTHEQALAAERAEAEAELEAGMSWEELMRHRYLQPPRSLRERTAAEAAARRRAEQARAAARYAAEVQERARRNRTFLPPWRAIVFITILLVILAAPYWGK